MLIVDDEPDLLAFLDRALRSRFDVTQRADGFSAAQTLAEQPFDLIVTDHRMPGFDGVELLERIRDQYSTMARLLLTGYDDSEEVSRIVNNGWVDLCLAKPVDLSQLMSAIDQAIKARKTRLADQ